MEIGSFDLYEMERRQDPTLPLADTLAGVLDCATFFDNWLDNIALPLWQARSYCTTNNWFFEQLTEEGLADVHSPVRARVPPRQIYAFSSCALRNGTNKFHQMLELGYENFVASFRTEAGYFGNRCSANGELIDAEFDLYNQAFAILMYARLAQSFPDKAIEFEEHAVNMLEMLERDYQHGAGGFLSSLRKPNSLESNPHMHLLEAAMTWEAVARAPAKWRNLSDDLARLALSRYIDQSTGALREFFAKNWAPAEGSMGDVIEPGHQFEWCWLLCLWGTDRNNSDAIRAAKRLYEIGRTYGLGASGRVIMTISPDFLPSNPSERLWPQTEWIKAASILARDSIGAEQDRYLQDIRSACKALRAFLSDRTEGAWVDSFDGSGYVTNSNAPASSFYHIVCAIHQLSDVCVALRSQSTRLANGAGLHFAE